MKRKLAVLFAFVGAGDCVYVAVLFGMTLQQPLFPLPGLYFLEIVLLGLVGLVSTLQNRAEKTGWGQFAPWGIAGILLTFNILGLWTIGLFLIPGTLSFLAAGMLQAEGKQQFGRGLGTFFGGAILQLGLMLALFNVG